MGGILSSFVGIGVDYLAGSITACTWEWVFNPYDPSKSTFLSVFEGLLQLTASVSTGFWLSGLLTPEGAVSNLGMVAIMYFIFSYSPNMRAKLQAGHTTTKTTLAFNTPSFLFHPTPPAAKE